MSLLCFFCSVTNRWMSNIAIMSWYGHIKIKNNPPWHCRNWKIANVCFVWKWSLIWRFFSTSVLSHVTNTLGNIFSQNWSKESQGYKSNILLLLYNYAFVDVFFRKSIIKIWESNPWRTNSSINGSTEQAFTWNCRIFL